jgi:hypothetical protein
MYLKVPFPGVKRPGHEGDHSSPFSHPWVGVAGIGRSLNPDVVLSNERTFPSLLELSFLWESRMAPPKQEELLLGKPHRTSGVRITKFNLKDRSWWQDTSGLEKKYYA